MLNARRYAILVEVSNGVPLIYLRWEIWVKPLDECRHHVSLTERNYYSNDVTNREPDIPPTTPHYRDICHRRRVRHLYLSSQLSVADVPADTVALYGPVHSSQSNESRSHYRSPNNHVLWSLAGRVRDVRGPAKQI